MPLANHLHLQTFAAQAGAIAAVSKEFVPFQLSNNIVRPARFAGAAQAPSANPRANEVVFVSNKGNNPLL